MTRNKLVVLCSLALIVGCSDDSGEKTDSGADKGVPTEAGADQNGNGPGLTGTVKDAKGVVVEGALVEAGGKTAYTTSQGVYTLDQLTAGAVTVKVAQDWFQDKSESATVAASGMTTLNITIDEHPLKVEAADKTLADTYNTTFDWTTDTISIVILPKPSRKALDNAIYYRNPALFRDTSNEKAVTPSPQPTITGTGAKNFAFPTTASKEALDLSTIVDSLDQTPLTTAEQADWMMYKPMFTWLADWDATKVQAMNEAGVAIRQQTWGDSTAVRPQDIEQVFLHGKEIWVQVVFENFVKLGSGIADDDGDGRKEIYARLATEHYTDEVINKLTADYITPTFDTHGMSKEINNSLNELYTTTAAEVEKYIAQPFDVPSVGQITYPFVVLKHSGGQKNVLLVGP